MARRLLGIDLGVASAHTAVAIAEDGTELARRRCVPTVESLAAVEAAALRDAPDGTRLEVVIEPSGGRPPLPRPSSRSEPGAGPYPSRRPPPFLDNRLAVAVSLEPRVLLTLA